MSTVSKDDNLALSSEDSSSPDESELELGLGLSLSHPAKYHHQHGNYARIFTAKDFSSSLSSVGTKRPADSLDATNRSSQVVGWPPLRTYRVNSFNANVKSTEAAFNSVAEKSKNNNTVAKKSADNGNDDKNINIKDKRHLKSSPFVKVNMDGIPIGRKVDLSAHSSYETLAETLEDMFDESTGVPCKGSNGEDRNMTIRGERLSILLNGSSKFVLTYEDKEGDWMLVGDVPWGMFLSSVKRLRIMRTSEANGLAPRLEEKSSRPKSKPK